MGGARKEIHTIFWYYYLIGINRLGDPGVHMSKVKKDKIMFALD
jgi:hypothetical protein